MWNSKAKYFGGQWGCVMKVSIWHCILKISLILLYKKTNQHDWNERSVSKSVSIENKLNDREN